MISSNCASIVDLAALLSHTFTMSSGGSQALGIVKTTLCADVKICQLGEIVGYHLDVSLLML